MTEGTRWQFVAFVGVLVVLYFLLRVGLGLGVLAPDLLAVALLLGARRMRAGQAAGLGFVLGLLDGAVNPVTFGAGCLALTVVGYLGSRSREWVAGDSAAWLVAYLFVGKVLYDLLVFVVLLLRDLSPGPATVLLVASPIAALYAAAAGLAAAAAYRSVA